PDRLPWLLDHHRHLAEQASIRNGANKKLSYNTILIISLTYCVPLGGICYNHRIDWRCPMSDELGPAVTALQRKLDEQVKAVAETKKTINMLLKMMGQEPQYKED